MEMNITIPWACRVCGKQNGSTRARDMTPDRFRIVKHKIAMAHSDATGCRCDYKDILFWYRHGECNDCGHCCSMIQPTHRFELPGPIRDKDEEAFLKTRGYTVEGKRAWIMTSVTAPCPEQRQKAVGADFVSQCNVWENRPGTCADFPITPAQVKGTPCSYWFEREDGRMVGGDDSPYPDRGTTGTDVNADQPVEHTT